MRLTLLAFVALLGGCAIEAKNTSSPADLAQPLVQTSESESKDPRSKFSAEHIAAADALSFAARDIMKAESLRVLERPASYQKLGKYHQQMRFAIESAYSDDNAKLDMSPRFAQILSPAGCDAATALLQGRDSFEIAVEKQPGLKKLKGSGEAMDKESLINMIIMGYQRRAMTIARFDFMARANAQKESEAAASATEHSNK